MELIPGNSVTGITVVAAVVLFVTVALFMWGDT